MTTLESQEISKIVDEAYEAIRRNKIDNLLMRNPGGHYLYVRLWQDGELTGGLEPSQVWPVPDAERSICLWSCNTPYDTHGIDSMPFGIKGGDNDSELVLVKEANDYSTTFALSVGNGPTGYLMARCNLEYVENTDVVSSVDWDDSDYLGDEPLVDKDRLRNVVETFLAGNDTDERDMWDI